LHYKTFYKNGLDYVFGHFFKTHPVTLLGIDDRSLDLKLPFGAGSAGTGGGGVETCS
jgi:hypothetical protein